MLPFKSPRSVSKFRGAMLAAWLVVSPCVSLLALNAADDGARTEIGGSGEALGRLRDLLRAKRANEEAQSVIWPQEGPEAHSEAPPPPGFEKLRSEHREIRGSIQSTLKELAQQAAADPTAILSAIRTGVDADFLQSILPCVLESRTSDRETATAIVRAAARLKPLPHSVAKALAELDSEEARQFLWDRGVAEKSAVLLAASTGPGDTASIGRLIDLAEGQNAELSKLAVRAIERLEPPELQRSGAVRGLSAEEIESRLKDVAPELRPLARQSLRESSRREILDILRVRIVKAARPELKTALIAYLGLFRDPSNPSYLRLRYSEAREDRTRLAVICALGRAPGTGALLLELAEAPESTPVIRRACIQALAAVKHIDAVPFFLDHLEDRECAKECKYALERISARKLGTRKAEWVRWWRSQPQGLATETDPDLIALRARKS